MAYTRKNYRTKKAVREAVAAGERVEVYQAGGIFPLTPYSGNRVTLEGPHYPEPHRWYAEGTVKQDNGKWVLTKVK